MEQDYTELEKHVKHDREAFACLYKLNYDRIFNYVLYSTGDVETSLDLTSETFFKALRALPRFEHRGGSFTAWLYKIASREIGTHYRRKKIAKVFPVPSHSLLEEAEGVKNGVIDSEVHSTQLELERCEDFLVLSPYLKRLPARDREVLFLRFFESMSFEDIATLLGRSAGTVRSQNQRALIALRKMMPHRKGLAHFNERGLETSITEFELQEEV